MRCDRDGLTGRARLAGFPRAAAPDAVAATAGGYLAQALNQLGAAGAAAAQISIKLKLQLLLVATAARPTATADSAVAKLAESVQALT